MFNAFYRFLTILLIISNVVLTQSDYEYHNFDEREDSPPVPHFRHGFHNERRGQRYRATPFRPLEEQAQIPKSRGMIGNTVGKASKIINGILGLGNCLIKCVISWVQICGGMISCPWNCLFPKLPLPQINRKQRDNDIVLETEHGAAVDVSSQKINSKGLSLSPYELVALVKCFVKCLVRYLPRDPISLTQMLVCLIMRCLCETSN